VNEDARDTGYGIRASAYLFHSASSTAIFATIPIPHLHRCQPPVFFYFHLPNNVLHFQAFLINSDSLKNLSQFVRSFFPFGMSHHRASQKLRFAFLVFFALTDACQHTVRGGHGIPDPFDTLPWAFLTYPLPGGCSGRLHFTFCPFCLHFLQVAHAPRGVLRTVTCHKRGACTEGTPRHCEKRAKSFLDLQLSHAGSRGPYTREIIKSKNFLNKTLMKVSSLFGCLHKG